MATVKREEISIEADTALLACLHRIADEGGREFQAVIDDALRVYDASQKNREVRPEFMAHLWASVEEHHLLGELLAK